MVLETADGHDRASRAGGPAQSERRAEAAALAEGVEAFEPGSPDIAARIGAQRRRRMEAPRHGLEVQERDRRSEPLQRRFKTPLEVTDQTFDVWLWHKFNTEDPQVKTPRAFKLKKGEHTLVFTNREDNSKLDQIYITDNPDDRPAGIMEK